MKPLHQVYNPFHIGFQLFPGLEATWVHIYGGAEYWDIIWKSRGGRVVNGVSREVPRPKPEGPEPPRVLAAGLP